MNKKLVAIACGTLLLYSCSSLRLPGSLGNRSRVVATEQPVSPPNVSTAVGETRTLFIKSDVKEESKELVAGCVLKDSTTLSSFSVVVGSFSQPTSAVSLIGKLKQKSLSPFFVRNEKGLYRLVAGTFQNKDDADYLVLKLDVSDIKAWVLAR